MVVSDLILAFGSSLTVVIRGHFRIRLKAYSNASTPIFDFLFVLRCYTSGPTCLVDFLCSDDFG
ncbi:hypothetical protein I7I53_11475 [Histoplasma capsulatum var. duboisii H88]|uniref:Uncharacterized protein n=1 Tax=Ajellomyces capsulatus (strain H88) TaxID=544711 RepID=A0A8A1LE33_AJEC8|nr:hypothetical protein I7I53_11475 [Histoplasma capsulatum var. duboisii H88]